MLFTRIKIDNFYSFQDFEVDLTYPRKLSYSSIDSEFIKDRPYFNVKRVCIISGPNATGKTSLAKVMCALHNLLAGRRLINKWLEIYKKNKQAEIAVEFVTPESYYLHEVHLKFDYSEEEQNVRLNFAKHRFAIIKELDSVSKVRKRLNSQEYSEYSVAELGQDIVLSILRQLIYSYKNESGEDTFIPPQWNYTISVTVEENPAQVKHYADFDAKLARRILCTFDPTIQDIKTLHAEGSSKKDPPSAYQIIFKNGDSVQVDLHNVESNITRPERLSKGTFESIGIIAFLRAMESKSHNYSTTYFLDERMAHIHTDLEIKMINLLISKLGVTSQFFYTTHNTDVLEMNLPIHSYLFLRRNSDNSVSAIQPEKIFKKNDRSLSNFVKNDVFKTRPDTSLIDEALYD